MTARCLPVLSRVLPRVFSILTLLVTVGCGGGGPATHTVTGTVIYQSNPVANAQVGFVPAEGTTEFKPAFAQTDESGRFSLKTYLSPGQEVGGAMAGKYKVTVQAGYPQDRIVTPEEMAKNLNKLPAKYADAASTPLEVTVSADGENNFPLEIANN